MIKKAFYYTLLIAVLSLPQYYFGMALDFSNRNIIGYVLVTIIPPILLHLLHIPLKRRLLVLILGNGIAMVTSIYLVHHSSYHWDTYFKPLYPDQYVVFLFIVISLLQIGGSILIAKHLCR